MLNTWLPIDQTGTVLEVPNVDRNDASNPSYVNPHRKLNTLDEVALRIHCATVSTSLDEYHARKERWLPSVAESYNAAYAFLHEAERRNPSPNEGDD